MHRRYDNIEAHFKIRLEKYYDCVCLCVCVWVCTGQVYLHVARIAVISRVSPYVSARST